jgi:tol-pal system protein YbgF
MMCTRSKRGRLDRSAIAAPVATAILLGVVGGLTGGCASQVDLDSIQRQQREMSRRLADTRADLESLKQSVASIRGSMEDVRHRGGGGSDYGNLDRRLQALEDRAGSSSETTGVSPSNDGASSGQTTIPPSPSTAGPVARVEPYRPPPEPVATPAANEAPRSADLERDLARAGATDYREGLQQFQRGDYAKAIQSLRGYVTKNPNGEYVANAHYWVGEAYYAQRKYNEAILEYNEILVNSPKSDRVPAALLRQASAFAELGDKIDARLILQKLTAEHPNTDEAAKAKQKLLSLGT